MAFFRTINFSEPLASIAGEGVTLRTPQMTDYSEWATLRETSRAFLTPWEPTWPADDLTRSSFRRRIRRYAEDLRTDQGYAFLIIRNADGALVGGLTLANIRRGVAQAASLGYWMGQPFVRRGLMTAAVSAVTEASSLTSAVHHRPFLIMKLITVTSRLQPLGFRACAPSCPLLPGRTPTAPATSGTSPASGCRATCSAGTSGWRATGC